MNRIAALPLATGKTTRMNGSKKYMSPVIFATEACLHDLHTYNNDNILGKHSENLPS